MPERTEDESLQYLADLLVDMFFEQDEIEKMRNASPTYIQELITIELHKEGFTHVTYSTSDDAAKSFTISMYDPLRRINEVSKKFSVRRIAHAISESCWRVDGVIKWRLGVVEIKVWKI